MNRLMDENRVLEKRGEDARQVIADREAELERITDAYAEKDKQWEEKWKKEERIRREAEKRAEDLKVVVDRLAMASGEGGGLSPAAALASGAKAGGKTYTQFYTDYTLMEGKLRASENEVSRLTQILDEISADLAEKVSSISSQYDFS
jgi:nucleoprotein TPR